MIIRPITPADHDGLWSILEPVIREGETYTLPRDWSREEALAYWLDPAHEVYVAELDGGIAGTYFLQANRPAAGSHVANCGYVTSSLHTGRGVARAMCRHSLETARSQGYRAMQFNFVVSTNDRAVGLWKICGFHTAGVLPGAFHHPSLGFVDGYVMYQSLTTD